MTDKLISLVIKVCDWIVGKDHKKLKHEFNELENKNAERKSKHDLKMKQMEKDFNEQNSRVSERVNFRKVNQ